MGIQVQILFPAHHGAYTESGDGNFKGALWTLNAAA